MSIDKIVKQDRAPKEGTVKAKRREDDKGMLESPALEGMESALRKGERNTGNDAALWLPNPRNERERARDRKGRPGKNRETVLLGGDSEVCASTASAKGASLRETTDNSPPLQTDSYSRTLHEASSPHQPEIVTTVNTGVSSKAFRAGTWPRPRLRACHLHARHAHARNPLPRAALGGPTVKQEAGFRRHGPDLHHACSAAP